MNRPSYTEHARRKAGFPRFIRPAQGPPREPSERCRRKEQEDKGLRKRRRCRSQAQIFLRRHLEYRIVGRESTCYSLSAPYNKDLWMAILSNSLHQNERTNVVG